MTASESTIFTPKSSEPTTTGWCFSNKVHGFPKWASSHRWGSHSQPVFERPMLVVLLLLNAALYFTNIGANGWANSFYSAAVQAGSMDTKALFFGSSDWGNSIAVDKPPLSLWVMGLSVRLFGFHPVAMLLPQALMGVSTTLLIYLLVRRYFSAPAALFSGLVFFSTPIITLMSRYNNPDPLMILLMVASVWFVMRSIDSGRGRYFVIAAAFLGLAFMTKQLQGLLCVPALGLAYLLQTLQSWPSRIRTIGAGIAALFVTGGLWMAVVDLTPQSQRPYVGGSPTNSALQLAFGHNGLGRVFGADDPVTPQIPTQFRAADSDAGLFRLLNANYNQEASWLLFAALLATVLLAMYWREPLATRGGRALSLIAGVWLITAFLLLSFMGNDIHTYYTAALAPPLAMVLGIAMHVSIKMRRSLKYKLPGAVIAFTALTCCWLILGGTSGWPDWLGTTVLTIGVVSISALVLRPPSAKVEVVFALVLCAALLCGPVITSVRNVSVAFSGSNPLSGMPSKNPAGISHLLESMRKDELPREHDIAFGRMPDVGILGILEGASGCTWAGATYPSQTAARLQLQAHRSVMPIGGFEGNDPSPTLDTFKRLVASGEICYYIEQETYMEGQRTDSSVSAISSWVRGNFRPQNFGSSIAFRLKND